jgi:hypothetical protein
MMLGRHFVAEWTGGTRRGDTASGIVAPAGGTSESDAAVGI